MTYNVYVFQNFYDCKKYKVLSVIKNKIYFTYKLSKVFIKLPNEAA